MIYKYGPGFTITLKTKEPTYIFYSFTEKKFYCNLQMARIIYNEAKTKLRIEEDDDLDTRQLIIQHCSDILFDIAEIKRCSIYYSLCFSDKFVNCPEYDKLYEISVVNLSLNECFKRISNNPYFLDANFDETMEKKLNLFIRRIQKNKNLRSGYSFYITTIVHLVLSCLYMVIFSGLFLVLFITIGFMPTMKYFLAPLFCAIVLHIIHVRYSINIVQPSYEIYDYKRLLT